VNYGAAGYGGTGAGGTSAGRGVYGVQGTTAGGRSYEDVGRAGGAVGPGGYAVGGRSNVGAVSGPEGTAVGGSRTAAAYGPGGAAGYATRGGYYGAAGARPYGTYYNSNADLVARGDYTRAAYAGASYFTPTWTAGYPGAWSAPSYVAGAATTPANWSQVAGYCGYPQQPSYYDYGGNVVSQPDAMYVNGNASGTPQQYAAQAGQIADAGTNAPTDQKAAWQPLGVFAVAPGDPQANPNEFFQLAVNPQGMIRGNYHNDEGDKTVPLTGAVDSKSLRAAWTVGDTKTPVFEAGIANLTNDQTTMLVHDDKGQSQQFTLVRMPPPDATAQKTQ
jgi:hypothetical protein